MGNLTGNSKQRPVFSYPLTADSVFFRSGIGYWYTQQYTTMDDKEIDGRLSHQLAALEAVEKFRRLERLSLPHAASIVEFEELACEVMR